MVAQSMKSHIFDNEVLVAGGKESDRAESKEDKKRGKTEEDWIDGNR